MVEVPWLSPLLLCASLLLIARSFYLLYVKGMRTVLTTIITWLSLLFIIGFWTWRLFGRGTS